ncbi:hypothetical protein B5S31_g911 [[Candida] boidinii]|nr:hypothetical protein B5S31_g911 [[Candida] boidinii]GME73845.1 unnamed protein product [[Candida] boidinii]
MSTPMNPNDLQNSDINKYTPEEIADMKSVTKQFIDENVDERLGLPAALRIPLLSVTAGILGGGAGLIHGYTTASYKYLASNSHRLPTTYNGWFFYHKRKNYYCFKDAMQVGFKTGVKLSSFIAFLFGIEAGLDYVRGVKDFGNTMMATSLSGFLYASFHHMNKYQAVSFVKRGGKLGVLLGLSEDFIQFYRGADVWYLRAVFGIQPMKLVDRLRNKSF